MISISPNKKDELRSRIRELAVPKKPLATNKDEKLPKMQGIKAVLFDVYGTILISGSEPMERNRRELQFIVFEETLNNFDFEYQPDAVILGIKKLHQIIERVHKEKKDQGIDYPEVDIIAVYETLFDWLKTEELIDDYDREEIPEIVTDFVTGYDQPWLMPGFKKLMAVLNERDFITGIISNSQFYTPLTLEALTEESLQEMGFDTNLLFWSFAEDIAKPSVRFYDIAAEKLSKTYSVKPEEVLFVGNDMLNDVYPADQAGFKTALFAGDRRSLRLRKEDERCQNTEPDVVLTELSQIETILVD